MATTSDEKLAINGGKPVRTKSLPWELPGAHWIGDEEIQLVNSVIKARSPFRYYGPDFLGMVNTLEDEFKFKMQRKFALGLASGTAALNVAFASLGIGPGDEVLVPGYLWVSCLSAIVRLGAIPRIVDIDDTFCMSPTDLENKITMHSKAVLFVNMSGTTGHIDKVVEIAKRKGLKVVVDCAQASGASLHGKPVGSFGDIAIYSFQLNKNMTCGEGGMLVCDNEHLYKRSFALHDLGYIRNSKGRLDTTDEEYQLWGMGCRMSEIAGAMALAQLRKLDNITGAMRTAKWKIRRQLSDIKGLSFRNVLDPEGDSGPFLITVYKNPEICGKFIKALQAEGIKGPEGSLACLQMEEWGLHWFFNNQSLVHRRSTSADGLPWSHPLNSFANGYDYSRKALPNCNDFASRSGILTIASCLNDEDINDIVTAFHKVARQILR